MSTAGKAGPKKMAATSKAAYADAAPRIPYVRDLVLAAVAESGTQGLTREEIAERIDRPLQSVCGPVQTLLKSGDLRDLGVLRKTKTGSAAQVVVAIPLSRSSTKVAAALAPTGKRKNVQQAHVPRGSGVEEDGSVEKRFRLLVQPALEGDCLLWQGEKTLQGYGKFKLAGRELPVHLLAYEMRFGELPQIFDLVTHTCAKNDCVNPEHIRVEQSAELQKRLEVQAASKAKAKPVDPRQGNLI